MLPSPTERSCLGQQVDLTTHVLSFFDNYRNFRCEKSTDAGSTWTEIATGVGNPLPTGPGGQFEFDADIPSFLSSVSDHLNQYRFSIASSNDNLNDVNCSYTAYTTITIYVDDCRWVLKTNLLNFSGKLVDDHAKLNWKTDNEESYTLYDIEKSEDGRLFRTIATVKGKGKSGSGAEYSFTDPTAVSVLAYYRIKIKEQEKHNYSKQLSFTTGLHFELLSPEQGSASMILFDNYGRVVHHAVAAITPGANAVNINNLGKLSRGIYTLQFQMGDKIITRKVLKI